MKKAIAIVKLALLGAVFAVTLTSIQVKPAEASYYCTGGTGWCTQPLIEHWYRKVWIP